MIFFFNLAHKILLVLKRFHLKSYFKPKNMSDRLCMRHLGIAKRPFNRTRPSTLLCDLN